MLNDLWNEVIGTVCNGVNDPSERQIIDKQLSTWDDSSKAWAILPSVSFAGKTLVLVALGREGERRALEVAAAFFGPVLTRSLAPSVFTLPSGRELCVNAAMISNDEWDRRMGTLRNLVNVRIGTQPIEKSVAQPLSILLRDFYLALNAGSESEAEEIASRIKMTGLLRGDNIEFLWVHRLATFGRFSEIFTSEKFDDLCRTRRSVVISEHLLRSLWERDFAILPEPTDVSQLRTKFRDSNLTHRYRDLLGSIERSKSAEVRTLLSLFFGELADSSRFTGLVEGLTDDEVARLQSISGQEVEKKVDTATPAATAVGAEHPSAVLLSLGDHLGVIAYFEAHPDDEKAFGFAMESASELDDTESASRVVSCYEIGKCPVPTSRIANLALESLRQKASGHCVGWCDWATRAANSSWQDVFQVVSSNAETWDTSWCDSFQEAQNFSSDVVQAFAGPNSAQVQQALAFILELVGSNATRVAIGEVRSAALSMLVALEMSNAQIRNAFVSLIASYEDGNVSVGEYEDLLDSASLIWGTYGSVSNFSWILDVVEQVLKLARLSEGKLQSLIHQVHGSLQSFGESLDPSLHNLFCKIVSEFVQVNPREIGVTADGEDVWGKYSGKKVGIYSLLESLPDLKIYLETICPNADFEINQEKVASNELRHFASHSDFVVIQTSKSKHAATEELNRYITGERIYVAGRGRGSIINALLNWKSK
jgi:hypothetical protein